MKTHEELSDKIRELMEDSKQSREQKIENIQGIYEYARSEQRTATESAMVDDDGLNEVLRVAEKALAELGAPSPAKKDSDSAATL